MYVENRISGNTPSEWAECLGLKSCELIFSTSEQLRFDRFCQKDVVWQEMRERIKLNETLIDAGCGMGQWVCYCRKHGIKADGLDYSQEMVSALNANFPTINWVQGPIQKIPLNDNSYNHLISWGVVEHDSNGPLTALQEFYRILKKDGYAFITTPLDSPETRHSSQIQFGQNGKFFQFFFTQEELETQMKNAGFTIEKTIPIHRSYAVLFPRIYKFVKNKKNITGKIIAKTFSIIARSRSDSHSMILVIGKKI